MQERVYRNHLRPVVYPFSKQPWVVNGLLVSGRKKGQQREILKFPFIFGEYTTKNNYPSARWQTENQRCYKVINFEIPGGRILIKSKDKHLPVEGVVPFDQPLNKFNVKKEMRLPAICDSLKTPSAANPNKYMLRKRMIPAPHPQMGIFYPESPDPVKLHEFRSKKHQADLIDLSSLLGKPFSRKKYIRQPRGNIEVGSIWQGY